MHGSRRDLDRCVRPGFMCPSIWCFAEKCFVRREKLAKVRKFDKHTYIYTSSMKYTFFAEHATFLLGAPVFSRALGCAARMGLACTPRRKCGSRPGSVARALGLQGREFWQVTTGRHSDLLEPSRTIENRMNTMSRSRFSHFLCCVRVTAGASPIIVA